MATTFQETFGARSARYTVSNGIRERTYTRTWRAQTDNNQKAASTLYADFVADQLIDYGSVYSNGTDSDSGSFVQEIFFDEKDDDGFEWVVTVNYGPARVPEADPLDEPIIVRFSFAAYEALFEQDAVTGFPVVNTAGDPFDPTLTMDDPRVLMVIVRNEGPFDPVPAYALRNTINDAIFTIAAPMLDGPISFATGTLKCTNITPDPSKHPDIGWYNQVTYEFEYNPNTWLTLILNQGFRQLDGSGNRQHILINGVPVSQPVPLDEDGFAIPPANVDADAHYLEFNKYVPADFSFFGFPTS